MAKKPIVQNPLQTELQNLITQLDEEGLVYLTEQAKIHIYNMKVDEHNRAVLAESKNAPAGSTGKSKKTGAAAAKPAERSFSLKGTESGSSYYLYYGTNSVMFSRSEMIHLVKIANGKGTDPEIRERLYNWFERERMDFFALVNIKNKFDERLKTLAALIKKCK
jgi:TnpA family transposase